MGDADRIVTKGADERQRQEQKQIPFGNDKQGDNGKHKGDNESNKGEQRQAAKAMRRGVRSRLLGMNLSLSEVEFPVYLRFDRAMTDDELMRFSSENELLRVEREPNGELIVMSSTGSEGGSAELDLGIELGVWARADGRGKAFGPNAGFTLPDSSVRAADAAWVSLARWNGLTKKQQKGYAPICPEFVIELRSEKDRLAPLERKMMQWIANGVEVGWLIDPKRRDVAIYRAGCAVEVHHDPSSVQGDGPVRGFELVMARVWG